MSRKDYAFKKKHLRWTASVLDAVGGRFRRGPASHPPSDPKKILVVRLDHLGDVLQATGIPQALKERYPSAEVIFLTSSAGEALLANNPYVDKVIRYDAPWFWRGGSPRAKTRFLGVAGELRRLGIDLGLSLRGDARENLLLSLGRVRYKVGYGITGAGFLLDRELGYKRNVHENQHALDVVRWLGIRRDMLLPSLYFSPQEEARADAYTSEAGGALVVGVQLDAGTQAKSWPEANRAEFLRQAFQQFPQARFVFVGGDRVVGAWLEKYLRSNGTTGVLNLMGKTGVRDLILRLKACRLFIGPDSGPSHLAAALGIPTLILYSGTNLFEQWRSRADNADILRHPVPCSPCGLKRCPLSDHPCMALIRPESVTKWLAERIHAS